MTYCITDITALAALRASGRLLPDLLDLPRTSKLGSCSIPPRQMLEDDMLRLGVTEKPYHLLFGSDSAAHARNDITRHVRSKSLSPRSLIRISKDLLMAGPERIFYDMCSSRELDLIDLVLLGHELCGFYVISDNWDGLIETGIAPTTVEKLKRFGTYETSRRGIRRAIEAIRFVHDHSNSPMETVLVIIVTLPRRYGGMGLGPVSLNQTVRTSEGKRFVDILFTERGVGLEYKGRHAHSLERVARDDRRQNKLVSSGISILNVWYEDLMSPVLFSQLMEDILRALHIRPKFMTDDFLVRQELLRRRLAPIVTKYPDLIP